MIEITELDRLIFNALNRIGDEFFKTNYQNIEGIRSALIHRNGIFNDHEFHSYGERIFCYELYHQLRLQQKSLEDIYGEVKIQGELRKINVIPLLEVLKLKDFEADLIPDILIHSPENADKQICAIEVKSINKVSTEQVRIDLIKLNTYCEKLQYLNAYFITINTSPKHIQNIIDDPELNLSSLTFKNKIKIICMENSEANIKIWQLNN